MTERDPAAGAEPDGRDLRMVEAVRLYHGGLTLRQVAARQSVSYQTVANDLARWNLERPRMPAELVQLAGDLTQPRMGRRPGLMPLGAMLRYLRVSRGLTQVQLARQIGRDISTIYKAEANKITVSEVLANQLANALGVDVEEILAGDDIWNSAETKIPA